MAFSLGSISDGLKRIARSGKPDMFANVIPEFGKLRLAPPPEPEPMANDDMQAAYYRAAGPTREMQLQKELDAKPSRLQRVLGAVIPAAGIALGGAFGGEEGATGAAMGVADALNQNRTFEANKRKTLLEQINEEKQRQQRQSEFDTEQGMRRQTLAEQMKENERAHQRQLEESSRQSMTLSEQMRHNKAMEDANRRGAKAMESYINDEGRQVVVFEEPDGSRKEQVFGKVQPKRDTAVTPYEDYRNKPGATPEKWAGIIKPAKTSGDEALAEAIMDNPELFNQYSAGTRERLTPRLTARGFSDFGKQAGSGALERIADYDTSLQLLDDLEVTIAQNPGNIGPLDQFQQYIPGSDAQAIRAQIATAKQVIGKALEGGVLRKEDEVKYEKILPQLSDTPAIAQIKINQVRNLIKRGKENYIGNQGKAGYRSNNPNSPLNASQNNQPKIIRYDAKGNRVTQ
jgi:hypothetical protein